MFIIFIVFGLVFSKSKVPTVVELNFAMNLTLESIYSDITSLDAPGVRIVVA